MKTELNTAKKLTLDEIKAMPKASVLWIEMDTETDEGIVWHTIDPVMICEPGPGGVLIGGNRDSYIDIDIDDSIPDYFIVWSQEPTREQLTGISEEEYNALTDEGKIVFPALAKVITSKGMTFKRFCKMACLNYGKFWKALTGQRDFLSSEISIIRNTLDLSSSEINTIFFPELARI